MQYNTFFIVEWKIKTLMNVTVRWYLLGLYLESYLDIPFNNAELSISNENYRRH